ncbi:MAG: hydrolase [Clostridia bacterium]|nr:hydrolase [Clostridia bacterium]MDQ7792418.1 hydrolase [Clostridia bacterium]
MLSTENTALLVIDIQGKLAHTMYSKEIFFENVRTMIKAAKVLSLPIIWMEQYPKGLGPTIPEIAGCLDGLKPIEKITFNSCLNDSFVRSLASLNRRQLIVTGMETHICVYQTVMGLLNADYEVHVVTDAVSSRTPENKTIGLEKMKTGGAHMTSTETVLFELLQIAEGPEFREILKLVK